MIKGSYLITTLLLLTGLMLEAQVCPMGTIWDANKMTCVKKEDQKNMEVVNYKCPNGYSWVSFKKECLINARVKEIYDSLTIEYLADPQLVDRKKLDAMADNSSSKVIENSLSEEGVAELTAELTALKEEIKSVKEYNEKLKTAFGEDPTILAENVATINKTLSGKEELNEDGVTNSSTGDKETIEFENAEAMELAILSNKNELKGLKEIVSKITKGNYNMQGKLYTFDVGRQHGVVAKTSMYGQKDIKFKIQCPVGFKWVAEESICLNSDRFLERSQAKAEDPNATIKYGIKDVKCPRSFRWSSLQSQCIPTLHAKIND